MKKVLAVLIAVTSALAMLYANTVQAADGPSNGRDADRRVLAIIDCTVFAPETEMLLPGRTIVIRGQKIVSVNGPDEPSEIPADAERIDGRGKFALPGLIDAHVHLVHVSDFAHVTGDELLPLFLAAGVTSVRSTGDEIVAATLVARFAQRHPESSPRVFTCSPLLDADPSRCRASDHGPGAGSCIAR